MRLVDADGKRLAVHDGAYAAGALPAALLRYLRSGVRRPMPAPVCGKAGRVDLVPAR